MSRPLRPVSFVVLLAAGAATLSPAPASGQDLEDVLRGIQRFEELRNRFEEMEAERERQRNRGPNAPEERPVRPDVNPAAPPAGSPPGLYGRQTPGPQTSGPQTPFGSPYGAASPYTPASPYDRSYNSPYTPQYGPADRNPTGQPLFNGGAQNRPAVDDGLTFYVMRNPGVRAGKYQVQGVPGGAVSVWVLDDSDTGGRRRSDRRDPTADAESALLDAFRLIEASQKPLTDLRYFLQYTSQDGLLVPLGEARRLGQQAAAAEQQSAALLASLLPSTLSFASTDRRAGLGGEPDGADRLMTWTDTKWAAAESALRNYDGAVRGLTAAAARAGSWPAGKATDLRRLHARTLTALDRVRAARGRSRNGNATALPGLAANGRPQGGDDRLRLYALSGRLTEWTGALLSAIARDPLLPVAAETPGVRRGLHPLDAARRADASARDLAAALAEGADGRTISAADAAFEQAWADWNTVMGHDGHRHDGHRHDGGSGGFVSAYDRDGDQNEVAKAAETVELIHEALHAAVPRGGAFGNNAADAATDAARRAARSASALDAALRNADLRALRGDRQNFIAASGQLAAAAGYYARVIDSAAVGAASERRARGVLDAAYNDAAGGLNALANAGRRDSVAGLARDVLNDLNAWRSAVRSVN